MQHAHVQWGGAMSCQSPEAQRKVLAYGALSVADTGYLGQQLTVPHDRMRLHVRADHGQIRRRAPYRRPAVERIVIAVRDENRDTALAEPFDAAQETELRPDAAFG